MKRRHGTPIYYFHVSVLYSQPKSLRLDFSWKSGSIWKRTKKRRKKKKKAYLSARALPRSAPDLTSSALLSLLESEMLEAVTRKKSCVRHGEPVTTEPSGQEKPRLGSQQPQEETLNHTPLPSAPGCCHKAKSRLTSLVTLARCRN